MTPDEVADRLEDAADNLGPAVRRKVRHVGTLGKRMIQNNASGRPGPNVITGQYRASWQAVSRALPHGATCTIGTDQPQGRRLEFGFMNMTDSLGRTFRQPPYPHVGPAVPRIEAALRDAMREAVSEVLS